jgi:MscS family membrane protein
VAEIPTLYEHHGYSPVAERLREIVPHARLLGLESWQWVGAVALLLVSMLAAWAVTTVLAWLIRRSDRMERERVARFFRGPVRFLLFVIAFREGVELLAPSLVVRAVLDAKVLLIFATTWILIRAADLLFDRLLIQLERERPGSLVFVQPVRTATRIGIVLIAGLIWLDNVGVDVTTLLAGLGIGGIALALAAQKSLEDVFGAITLMSSRPVRVGDFCRFGDRIGTIEEIGLRWTRVRTLDHTVVSVPNSEFSKQQLENFTLRRKIWYHPRLKLRYETSPDQLRYILVEIRKLLYGHPRVLPDPARIRFVGFSDWSLDLDVFAYVDSQDFGEFLEIAEDLNLRVMRIVTEAGSGFAVPSQTTYIETGMGIDADRARAAEACVGEWREKQELYLPRFPEPKIAELRGSLPYPPEGSPEALSHA